MSQPLCVVIHGFTGNPNEVKSVTEELQKTGYEVVAPLLPGHSYTIEQLPKVQAENWVHAVDKIVAEAVLAKREIHVIGFSMGAMIAAIMAHRYILSSLTLLSPAIYVVTPHLILTRTKGALRLWLQDRVQARKSFRDNWYATRYTPMHNVFQFRKLVRQARAVISEIKCRVCIVYGRQDEIVDPRSSYWIHHTIASANKHIFELPQSGHFVCQDCERARVVEIVTDFLQQTSEPVSNSVPPRDFR